MYLYHKQRACYLLLALGFACPIRGAVCQTVPTQISSGTKTTTTPWQAPPGVTLTVDQIMAQAALEALQPEKIAGHSSPSPAYTPGLPQDPNAVIASQWPPVSANPVVQQTDQIPTTAPQSPAAGLSGIAPPPYPAVPGRMRQRLTRAPQGWNSTAIATGALAYGDPQHLGIVLPSPPDCMGDAGPNQFLLCINGRMQTFAMPGSPGGPARGQAPAPDHILDISTDIFFDSKLPHDAGGNRLMFTSDPRVRYDRLSGRWFITMIGIWDPYPPAGVSDTANEILLAVSSGPTITSPGSFTLYAFTHDQAYPTVNMDNNRAADFDTLAVDNNALYIGVNIFDKPTEEGGLYLSSSEYVIPKAPLIGQASYPFTNGTMYVTPFRGIAIDRTSGPYTPQGVDNDDPNATEGYVIGPNAGSFGQLVLRKISDPGGSPSISADIIMGTNQHVFSTDQPFGNVIPVGSDYPIADHDDRLSAARMHLGPDGKQHLWVAQTLAVDCYGDAMTNSDGSNSSLCDRDGCRWYDIINLAGCTPTTPPTVNQSGTFCDNTFNTVAPPQHYWHPSCAMTGQGHMALGCSTASTAAHGSLPGYLSVASAGRLFSDAAGNLEAPIYPVQGSADYKYTNGLVTTGTTSTYLWGDFSTTTVDPNDDMTIWTVQEYCNAQNSWAVAIIPLQAPPPATPYFCSTPVASGSTANVVVTGLSVNGSGFFVTHPNPAGTPQPGQLSVTINVGGTVLTPTITSYDATHIGLQVTVPSNIGNGASGTITVTNPDGQSVTSQDMIFYVGTWGAVDVSVDSQNRTLVLWKKTDGSGKMEIDRVDDGGNVSMVQQITTASGWDAVAMAGGLDGNIRVLWRYSDNSTGYIDVYNENSGTLVTYYPTGTSSGLKPLDVAVDNNNQTHVLVVNYDNNEFSVWSYNDTVGIPTQGPWYNMVSFWRVYRIGGGSDGSIRVLWQGPDGSGAFWRLNATNDNYSSGNTAWSSGVWPLVDVASGADGNDRLLLANASGQNRSFIARRIVGSGTQQGNLIWPDTIYGPYSQFTPAYVDASVAAAGDLLTRILLPQVQGNALLCLEDSGGNINFGTPGGQFNHGYLGLAAPTW